MRKVVFYPLSTAFLLLLVAAAAPVAAAEWSYSGATGPEHWGSLKPEYAACDGVNQSPIDIDDTIDAELAPIDFRYTATGSEILNNGHTIQVSFTPGSTITFEGHTFELKQIHFHAPSEYHLRGRSFPLEGHLVHADADGNLAVVGVFYEEGGANDELSGIWKEIPKAGETRPFEGELAAADLLPANRDYFRFNGSLTTPPCSEGVRWLVMKNPVEASEAQMGQYFDVFGHGTNRPIQPVGARPLLE